MKNLNPIFKTSDENGKHHFFGYYDKCPWSKDGRYLLALETDFIDRLPTEHDVARIGIIDLEGDKKFKKLAETRAWNWQQGSRLQWLPPANNRQIVFNDLQNRKFVSVILDIQTKEKKILPMPIYTIDPRGEFALTVNFSRLNWIGGYGYAGLEDPYRYELTPENDGIYKLDLKTGELNLIISIFQIAGFKNAAPPKSPHYLTHILFNRGGTRFCFLHRFRLNDGGIHTRLFTANPGGSDLYCLAEGSLSHFDWFNDNQILIWGRYSPLLTNLRKRNFFKSRLFKPLLSFVRSKEKGFLRHRILGDRCLLFTDKGRDVKPFGVGVITEDSHFTRYGDTPWLVGDSYPDLSHFHSLFLYNLETNKRVSLGKFYSLPDESRHVKPNWDLSALRVDLHPRFSRNGRRVCFDSVHEGSRQVYVLDVSEIVNHGEN